MTDGAPPRARGILGKRAERSPLTRKLILPAQSFIQMEGLGGAVLLAAAVAALVWANVGAGGYTHFWEGERLVLDLGPLHVNESLRELVNSGLMAIFFFVVGLEVKRQLFEGEFSEPRKAALPAFGALGGMLVPVGIYLAVNLGGPGSSGWGVPMATDIAFALGVLALLGSRVPAQLSMTLLALAMADDIAAILAIAVFYAADISFVALGMATGLLALILLMQRLGVRSGAAFVIVGVLFWFVVFESGVHATIAGAVLGFVTPLRASYDVEEFRSSVDPLLDRFDEAREAGDHEEAEVVLGRISELLDDSEPALDRAMRLVHPWSSFVVLPTFALANAGVELSGSALADAAGSPIALGIAAGLVLGKPLGVVTFAWLATRLGLAALPRGVELRHMAGLGLVAGIGFTVSLFIAGIAFRGPELASAKLGVLVASVAAGLAGLLVLRWLGGDSGGAGGAPRREEDHGGRLIDEGR